jgi:hypothetical protein
MASSRGDFTVWSEPATTCWPGCRVAQSPVLSRGMRYSIKISDTRTGGGPAGENRARKGAWRRYDRVNIILKLLIYNVSKCEMQNLLERTCNRIGTEHFALPFFPNPLRQKRGTGQRSFREATVISEYFSERYFRKSIDGANESLCRGHLSLMGKSSLKFTLCD